MANGKARLLRKNLTDAEIALWKHLRMRQMRGLKFRRQAPIGPFIVDFVSFEAKLVIELDGGQHALQMASDKRRTTWLNQQGFKVLRFWDNEVLKNMENVEQAIYGSLFPPPLPSPPPQGARENNASIPSLGDNL